MGIPDAAGNRPTLQFTAIEGLVATSSDTSFTNVILDGDNVTGTSLPLITCRSTEQSLSKLNHIAFKNVDFINLGDRSAFRIDYASDVTIDGCNISANTVGLGFNSCKNVILKNTTISSANPTAAPTIVIGTVSASDLEADDVQEMTFMLNNTGFDFRENNTFTTIATVYIGLLDNDPSIYPVKMSYGLSGAVDLLLPAALKYAYAGVIAAFPSFQSDAWISTSTEISNAQSRSQQWDPTYYSSVTVMDLTSGEQIFPDGYEANSNTGPTVPGPPTNLTAAPGNQSIAVSWSAPASTGGADISGYNVYWTGDENNRVSNQLFTSELSTVIPNLMVDVSYNISVAAVNSAGVGWLSPSVVSMTNPAPLPPTDLVATGLDSSISVSWTPVAGATHYNIVYDSQEIDVSASSVLITGLENERSYLIRISTVSLAGISEMAEVFATPTATPLPTLTAVAGDGRVTLDISNNDTTISTFTYGYLRDGQPIPMATSQTFIDVGRVNGTAYTYIGILNGVESAPVTVTPVGPPATPSLTTARGVNSVILTITPPLSDGMNGAGTLTYTIQRGYSHSPDGSATSTLVSGYTAETYTDTTVQSGATYYYAVVANNGILNSTSYTFVEGSAAAVPSAPGSPTVAQQGALAVLVSWTAPASNGSNISGYTVTWSTGSQTTAATSLLVRNILSLDISFGIIATNGVGSSARATTATIQPLQPSDILNDSPSESDATDVMKAIVETASSPSAGLENILVAAATAGNGAYNSIQKNKLVMSVIAATLQSNAATDPQGNVKMLVSGAAISSALNKSPSFNPSKPYYRVAPNYTQSGKTFTSTYILTSGDKAVIANKGGYLGFSMGISDSSTKYYHTITWDDGSVTLHYDGAYLIDSNGTTYSLGSRIAIDTAHHVKVEATGSVTLSDDSDSGSGSGSGTVCFLGTAPVLTPSGYKRIDSLKVGDLVQTASGSTVAIRRVHHQLVMPGPSVNPFVIPKGLLGATETIAISPRHCVVVPGRGYVEARDLDLDQMPMKAAFDYYNLELPEWENMIVAGVTVESLAPKKQVVVTMAQMKKILAKAPAQLLGNYRKLFESKSGKLLMQVPANRPSL